MSGALRNGVRPHPWVKILLPEIGGFIDPQAAEPLKHGPDLNHRIVIVQPMQKGPNLAWFEDRDPGMKLRLWRIVALKSETNSHMPVLIRVRPAHVR